MKCEVAWVDFVPYVPELDERRRPKLSSHVLVTREGLHESTQPAWPIVRRIAKRLRKHSDALCLRPVDTRREEEGSQAGEALETAAGGAIDLVGTAERQAPLDVRTKCRGELRLQ